MTAPSPWLYVFTVGIESSDPEDSTPLDNAATKSLLVARFPQEPINISIDDVTLEEGDSGTTAFTFTMTLDEPASYDITVVANTQGVTATGGGVDFADIVNQTLTSPSTGMTRRSPSRRTLSTCSICWQVGAT